MYANFECIFVYLYQLIVNKTNPTNPNLLSLIYEGISIFYHHNFFRMTVYTIYDYPEFFFKKFLFSWRYEWKTLFLSFLRDTCMKKNEFDLHENKNFLKKKFKIIIYGIYSHHEKNYVGKSLIFLEIWGKTNQG